LKSGLLSQHSALACFNNPQWPDLNFAGAYSENENVPRFSGVPLTEHQPKKLSSKVNILGGHFGVVAAPHPSGTGIPMEYKGVEYSVVQLTDDTGWRWEVRFGDGKNKSGVTPVSRAFAIKLAEYEIDRTLKDRK
jgi:hypothetical protein